MQSDIPVLTKAETRKLKLAQRSEIEPSRRSHAHLQLLEALDSIEEFRRAGMLFSYVSTPLEVETHQLIRRILADEDRRLTVPAVSDNGLCLHELTHWRQLKPGFRGILEPDPTTPVIAACQPECFLVPGVAFDSFGNRIGYGGGYFDQLLRAVSVPLVGLCYDLQFSESKLPVDPWDVPVHSVVALPTRLGANARVIRTRAWAAGGQSWA